MALCLYASFAPQGRTQSASILSIFQLFSQACQPKHYQEDLVGQALHQLLSSDQYSREDIWVQTKFTSLDGQDPNRVPYDKTKAAPDQVKESIEASRRNLRVDVIDSLVLHSPMRGGLQDEQ